MSLEPELKLAVLEGQRFAFGDSEVRLLESIAREGTLAEGASVLGLSYRVAWGKLRLRGSSGFTPGGAEGRRPAGRVFTADTDGVAARGAVPRLQGGGRQLCPDRVRKGLRRSCRLH